MAPSWAPGRFNWHNAIMIASSPPSSPVPWRIYIPPHVLQNYKGVIVCIKYAVKNQIDEGNQKCFFKKMKNIKNNWCPIILTFPLQMFGCFFPLLLFPFLFSFLVYPLWVWLIRNILWLIQHPLNSVKAQKCYASLVIEFSTYLGSWEIQRSDTKFISFNRFFTVIYLFKYLVK